MDHIKISPSILSANQDKINEDIREIEEYSDLLHVDMMDGEFVPNISFTFDFIRSIKTKLPLDIHLMVNKPSYSYINMFDGLNVEYITIHYEATKNLLDIIRYIKSKKIKVGLAIKPNTSVEKIISYLDNIDMLSVMTVEPGKGGQQLITRCLDKVKQVRTLKPDLDIEVDGGINKETIYQAFEAGANVFVAGSAIFKKEDKVDALLDIMGQISPVACY